MVHHSHAFYYLHLLPLLVVLIYGVFVSARDTLTIGQLINDTNGETLTSTGEKFQLGFFTPKGSSNEARYIGIWYVKDPEIVVWVANRDNSLRHKGGALTVYEDGDLKLTDEYKTQYFSTQVRTPSSTRTVKLLDTGNLILTDDERGKEPYLWQSFDHPTDTFLPGMKMNDNLNLTSWKNSTDPASGNFTFQQDQQANSRYMILKTRTKLYWRSGGASRSFIPNQIFDTTLQDFLLSNLDQLQNVTVFGSDIRHGTQGHNVSLVRDFSNTRVVMNYTGEIQYYRMRRVLYGSEPKDRCSVYNVCGKSGKCSNSGQFSCSCLPGFERSSGDNSNGCSRVSNECSTKEEFLNLNVIKVGNPDLPSNDAESEEKCREECRLDCNCVAYAYVDDRIGKRNNRQALPDQKERSRTGCWIWNTDLNDLQEDYGDGAQSLYVKEWVSHTGVSNSGGANPQPLVVIEYSQYKETSLLSPKQVVILTVAIIVIALFCIISYIIWRRSSRKRKESIPENRIRQLYDRERQVAEWIGRDQLIENDKNVIDVPFFDLESILVATNYFSDAKKLGQGGFGPVYKGEFSGGQVLVVKRLSSHSGQGLQEFKNEVMLIAKLQHRNLVRILGYCVEGEEKILLYEYMPNKSLDVFIFDKTLGTSLDWARRFDIILGIARGLMYLHHDSRLRIIHRDLKTSNILLDEEMNPKISDFGLAKIVEGKETRANTNRVVGSYGYMSPEYALDGEFSIKSYVFSFGVVVLEIISGKKNTGFYQSKIALNLLGYAWVLWKEDNALALVDSTVAESCNRSEVLKCINIGLLCVQEDPSDRPTISNVIFMLGGETETLPHPKQPAFVERKRLSSTPSSSSSKLEPQSSNNVTFSVQEGR